MRARCGRHSHHTAAARRRSPPPSAAPRLRAAGPAPAACHTAADWISAPRLHRPRSTTATRKFTVPWDFSVRSYHYRSVLARDEGCVSAHLVIYKRHPNPRTIRGSCTRSFRFRAYLFVEHRCFTSAHFHRESACGRARRRGGIERGGGGMRRRAAGARAWAWWVVLGAAAGARELDPAACGARFDVQRDKIIRTEESRDMGARYLSELDVGARPECLRLCCETDACDVFVYEEKGPGSCYLFNCGPPEDFRCKFTAHSNFSSGVLALSRRLAELQDQEQRARREQELARLRAASAAAGTSPPPAPSSSSSPPPPPPPPPPHAPPGRCSRYQFECRRGGECIAVYNACDGVPQCADGSDEAPELGCPPPSTRAPPPTPAPAPVPAPAPAPSELAPAERWPHRLAQAQPPRRGPDGGGSHIFSHKGGLLQEADGAAYAPFEPPAAWPRRVWPPQPPGVEAMNAWGGGYARDWDRAWPVPPRADAEPPVYIPPKTMPEVPVPYPSGQQTLRDSAKKGPEPPRGAPPAAPAPPDLREEPRPAPPPGDSPAPLTPHKDKAPPAAPAAERHLAADEHDGLSEHPPAAVLLLVLGVALTAALGATVGCRARAARRRLRRGKPYAHDADYLVNGMYL